MSRYGQLSELLLQTSFSWMSPNFAFTAFGRHQLLAKVFACRIFVFVRRVTTEETAVVRHSSLFISISLVWSIAGKPIITSAPSSIIVCTSAPALPSASESLLAGRWGRGNHFHFFGAWKWYFGVGALTSLKYRFLSLNIIC